MEAVTISIKISALLGAIIAAGIAVFALVSPKKLGELVDVKAVGNNGIAEIRAMYGGGLGALAAYVLWFRTDRSFQMAGVIWAGFALARIVSLALQKSWTLKPFLFVVLEVFVAFCFLQ